MSDEEWRPVYSHPTLGVSILRHTDGLASCLPGIQYHHERYDGNGYPSGLKGNNIPLDARIIAIADAYEAMTSPRPYRERTLTSEEALKELARHKNTQGARVLAVADAFDAITSDRVYRESRSVSEALAVLVGASGGQFDPELVVVFVKVMKKNAPIELEVA